MLYLFLAEGFEEVEALTAVLELKTVSINDSIEVTGAHNIMVKADCVFKDADMDKVRMLILPGGNPGWKNLNKCKALTDELEKAANNDKYIAAICGAPYILGTRGLLKGKRACCYPGMENHLEGALTNSEEVNVDGKLITSRGVGTAIPFSLAIIKELLGSQKADEIAASIVYNA